MRPTLRGAVFGLIFYKKEENCYLCTRFSIQLHLSYYSFKKNDTTLIFSYSSRSFLHLGGFIGTKPEHTQNIRRHVSGLGSPDATRHS